MAAEARAVVVMGVAGAGKTTVGRRLAAALGWPFFDADDFHSAANVGRMAAGFPLTDEERRPWLAALNRLLTEQLGRGQSLVLACSALKASHREQLRAGLTPLTFIYLRVARDVLDERLRARLGHYMPATLLDSQLAALEEPAHALVVDAGAPPEVIVRGLVPLLVSLDDVSRDGGSPA